MSDFKAKMHQIRFRLGLRPRPLWGSLQRSPDPLAGFKGAASRQGGEGKGMGKGKGEGWGGTGTGGGGREKEVMEEGRGKGERGNGKDRTGHGVGKGKEEGQGKGGEGLQPPNFNSWRRCCACSSSRSLTLSFLHAVSHHLMLPLSVVITASIPLCPQVPV